MCTCQYAYTNIVHPKDASADGLMCLLNATHNARHAKYKTHSSVYQTFSVKVVLFFFNSSQKTANRYKHKYIVLADTEQINVI